MPTGLALIHGALELIGAIDAVETVTPEDAAMGLRRLQSLLDSWAAKRLTMHEVTRTVYPVVVGQATYTIGPGGNFNQARPMWIDNAGLILGATSPETEIPVSILTQDQYAAIGVKDLDSAIISAIYYTPTNVLGRGTITVWPVPDTTDNDLVLYTVTAITGFATLLTNYLFPPGYQEGLEYALAVRLAPIFGKPVPPDVQKMADDTFATLCIPNVTPQLLTVDPAMQSWNGSRYNIFTDNG